MLATLNFLKTALLWCNSHSKLHIFKAHSSVSSVSTRDTITTITIANKHIYHPKVSSCGFLVPLSHPFVIPSPCFLSLQITCLECYIVYIFLFYCAELF